MPVRLKTAGADEFLDVVGGVGDATDTSVELEVLMDCEEVCGVELRAYAEASSSFCAVGRDGDVVYQDFAAAA